MVIMRQGTTFLFRFFLFTYKKVQYLQEFHNRFQPNYCIHFETIERVLINKNSIVKGLNY